MFKIPGKPKMPKFPTKAQRAKTLTPGDYTSIVIDVVLNRNKPDEMVDVSYELTDSAGTTFPYSESFRVEPPFGKHSLDFFDYLDENGITDWNQLLNCQEHVKLDNETKDSGTYLNIVDREFLYEEAAEDDTDAE